MGIKQVGVCEACARGKVSNLSSSVFRSRLGCYKTIGAYSINHQARTRDYTQESKGDRKTRRRDIDSDHRGRQKVRAARGERRKGNEQRRRSRE
jgi:hypothetical protein